ncbi:hypothetical protein Hanom_Chr09g00843031 [Helianthus anomalus]
MLYLCMCIVLLSCLHFWVEDSFHFSSSLSKTVCVTCVILYSCATDCVIFLDVCVCLLMRSIC